jgi:tetratricopeptide (TPR) repeat protein
MQIIEQIPEIENIEKEGFKDLKPINAHKSDDNHEINYENFEIKILPNDITKHDKSPRKFSRSDDNQSTVISVTKEDSIFQEAKNNIQSPSQSDIEGVSPPQMSNFFNSSEMLISSFETSDIKDQAKKCLENGNKYRIKANQLFKKNKFKDALGEYIKAVDELNFLMNLKYDSLNMTNINWVRMECLNRISVCYIVLKEYHKVLEYTSEVLKINSNNFIALSYRAKALIATKCYLEAQEVIKLALSVKYSKSLMCLLKEVEEKINPSQKNLNSFNTNSNDQVISLTETNKTDTQDSLSEKREEKDFKKHSFFKRFLISILYSMIKFGKIFGHGVIETIKKYKFGLIVLLIIYIIIFRNRLKNKLLSIMRIKFN